MEAQRRVFELEARLQAATSDATQGEGTFPPGSPRLALNLISFFEFI